MAVKEGHAIWRVDTRSGKASVLTGGNGLGMVDGLPAEARSALRPDNAATAACGATPPVPIHSFFYA